MVGYIEDFEGTSDIFTDDGFVEAIEHGKIVTVEESYAFREGLPILKHVGDNKIESVQEKVWKEGDEKKANNVNMEGSGLMDLLANNQKSQMEGALIDHFNWKICQARREKAMTRKRFGELTGLNLKQIKMLENGIFPTNDLTLLARIEEVLGIQIRKGSEVFSQPMRKMVEVGGDAKEDLVVEEFSGSMAEEEVVENSINNSFQEEGESVEKLVQETLREPARGVGWKAMTRKWSDKRGKENDSKEKREGKENEIDLDDIGEDLMSSDDIELL
jgi:transcriptional regulator with XRE-family HTH domain